VNLASLHSRKLMFCFTVEVFASLLEMLMLSINPQNCLNLLLTHMRDPILLTGDLRCVSVLWGGHG